MAEFNVQARIEEARGRLEAARPHVLKNLMPKGTTMGKVRTRVMNVIQSRPTLKRALNGTLLSNGKPTDTTAKQESMDAGFREVPDAASTEIVGKYRSVPG